MLETFQQTLSSGLLFQELVHGLFATPFAVLIWYKTRSAKSVALVLFITYLVDVDHLVDYFSFSGFRFSLRDFLSAEYFEATKRSFTPLHAWEWAAVLGYLSKQRGWKSHYTNVFFGYLPHLIYDSINVGSVVFYSIIYRALLGFRFV